MMAFVQLGAENLILLCVMIVAYMLLSRHDSRSFSAPMGIGNSIYFSTCTQSTVGFGDIHPVSSKAKLLVTIHIVATIYCNLIRPVHKIKLHKLAKILTKHEKEEDKQA